MTTSVHSKIDNGETVALTSPFIHKFQTSQANYIYDVNRNSILRVSRQAFRIIDDYSSKTLDEIIIKFKDDMPESEVRAAYTELKEASSTENYFISSRPRKIQYSLDESNLWEMLSGRLNMMTLEVTQQCNLRCAYCPYTGTYTDQRQHSPKYMTVETVRAAIDFLHSHSQLSEHVSIGFYGGEPLLNAKLIKDSVAYAKECFGTKPVQYHMTTNATILTQETAEWLIENDFNLVISLDGPQSLHDRYRRDTGGRGSYQRVQENLQILRALDPEFYINNVSINMVLAPPYSYDSLDDFLQGTAAVQGIRVRASYVDGHGTTFYDDCGGERESDQRDYEHLYEGYLALLAAGQIDHFHPAPRHALMEALFGEEITRTAANLIPSDPLGPVFHPGGICVPGIKKLYVSYDGRFFICEKVSSASDLFCIGDLAVGINAGKVFHLIEKYFALLEDCTSCFAARHCTLCFNRAYSGSSLCASVKMNYCRVRRKTFHKQLISIMGVLEKNPKAFDYVKYINFE